MNAFKKLLKHRRIDPISTACICGSIILLIAGCYIAGVSALICFIYQSASLYAFKRVEQHR